MAATIALDDNPSKGQRQRHTSEGDSVFKRRTSRPDLRLDFSNIPRYECIPIPVRDRTEEEGCLLFRDFLRELLKSRGLDVPNQSILTPADRVKYSLRNPEWVLLREKLQEMVAAFEPTKECTKLHQQSLDVDIHDIQEAAFGAILKRLFVNGGENSKENILVLFVFSADLVIRSLGDQDTELFDRILKWTLNFVTDSICPCVRQNGGWDQVLDNSSHHFPKIVAAATIALLAVMSYKWISHRL